MQLLHPVQGSGGEDPGLRLSSDDPDVDRAETAPGEKGAGVLRRPLEGATSIEEGEEQSGGREADHPILFKAIGNLRARESSRVLYCTPLARALFILACLQCVGLIIVTVLLVKRSPPEVPTPPCVEPCPMDWLYNGRKCYHFSKEEAEWEDSQGICSSSNASLALIDTQEELDFMLDLICRKHMWIGLRYSGTQFHWVNGTACNSKVCAITDEGECVYMGSKALRVSGCSPLRPFICTKKPHI